MGRLILVTGGVRSGKSDFAQSLAARFGGDRVLFVATAEGLDDEMRRRILAHQESRPPSWRTVEATNEVGRAVRDNAGGAAAVVIDCLTLLVSNTLLALGDTPDPTEAEARAGAEVAAIVEAARAVDAAVIVVSGEVGLGLVPANPVGRLFRDVLGRANQRIAAAADSVYFMVAGIPLDVKALASRNPDPAG